jgi:3-isopropylmalate dehydrogenase
MTRNSNDFWTAPPAGERAPQLRLSTARAPDIAGHNKADPTSLILSAAMLLAWLGEGHSDARLGQAAGAIDAAVDATIAHQPVTQKGGLERMAERSGAGR